MISIAKRNGSANDNGHSHDDYSHRVLPVVQQHAGYTFRMLDPESREEAIAHAVAASWAGYGRLMEEGRHTSTPASMIAFYAVRQVKARRPVGSSANSQDVASPSAQWRHGFRVLPLEALTDDCHGCDDGFGYHKRVTPADLVASRLDFRSWLAQLGRHRRQVAEYLANGYSTNEAAERFGVTAGRISQMRREFRENWQRFEGES